MTTQLQTAQEQLQAMIDIAWLCRYLGKALNTSGMVCPAHSYAHTRAYLHTHAPTIDAEEVVRLFEQLGATCDCEISLHLCGRHPGPDQPTECQDES